MPKWARILQQAVYERDGGMCLRCRAPMAEVHHIVPRSRKPKWSKAVWRIENMCCICKDCHAQGQTVAMRAELLQLIAEEYQYDMSWLAEFQLR